jgi:hypothetical protein
MTAMPRGAKPRPRTDRPISPEHLRRLRAIVVEAGSVHGAHRLLRTSPDVVEDALTRKIFRTRTIENLEARIDEHIAQEPGP